MTSKQPALLLLPNLLDEAASHTQYLPSSVDEAVASLDGIIAESEKGARKFLRRFAFPAPKTFREIPISLLNEHTQPKELDELLIPISKGERWGVISDCGLACLADPGAHLVYKARQRGISIEVFPGPSSLIYALMLSGLSAQRFAFHGYLPKEEAPLISQIKQIQTRSLEEKSTHLFIETPYRNQKIFNMLLQHLHPDTLLCLAVDLTLPDQWVMTHTVNSWKKQPAPGIDKRPTVFLVRASL